MTSTTRKRNHPKEPLDLNDIILHFEQLSNDDNHNLCQKLFEKCPATVLSRIGNTATLMRKRDFISDLSTEISTKILRYLPTSRLLIGQRVCKRWKEIIRGLPFIQLVSERLGVDKSEYGTDEQAIAICRTVHKYTKRTRNSFDDCFSYVPYELVNDGGIITLVAFAKYGDVSYIIIVMKYENGNDQGHAMSVSLANVDDIRNGQFTPLCRFGTREKIYSLKFLSPESIFCGMRDGTIERWNMRSELVFTYRQQNGAVFAINGNEERDLLFSGGKTDLRCWRMSTGELLCQIQLPTVNWISSIKLRLSTDSSAPVIGVLLFEGPLHIFSYLEDDRKFERLYESEFESVKYVTSSKEGFRFLHHGGDSGYYAIMEYCVQTGDVRRQDICWDTYIIEAKGMGAKYCLLDVRTGDDDEREIGLVLFEKRDDGEWHEYKESRIKKRYFVMADDDWLNGFRPHNTKGVAFASFDAADLKRKKMQIAFWK